jgi:hypothetical protein
MQMAEHDRVDFDSEDVAHAPKGSYLRELNGGRASQLRLVEVLVADGIAPMHQELQLSSTPSVRGSLPHDLRPQGQAEARKVAPDVAGGRIASIQEPPARPVRLNRHLEGHGLDGSSKVDGRLRMKVPAECLKSRRQQYDIGLIDLLCGIPQAPTGPAHDPMSAGDLIEGVAALVLPALQRPRSHPLRDVSYGESAAARFVKVHRLEGGTS